MTGLPDKNKALSRRGLNDIRVGKKRAEPIVLKKIEPTNEPVTEITFRDEPKTPDSPPKPKKRAEPIPAPKLPADTDQAIADFFRPRAEEVTLKEEVPQADSRKMLAPKDKFEVRTWEPGRRRHRRSWLMVGGFLGAVLALIILLSTTFARVSISLTPTTDTFNLPPTPLKVSSDANAIDPARGIIPGEMITFTESRQVTAKSSGHARTNQKAKGTILITNAFGTDPQVLIIETRFQTPEGKIYRLDKGVTVPGAKSQAGKLSPSTIQATVSAADVGPLYNSGPVLLKIVGFKGTPKYQTITATAANGFSGGVSGESNVITEIDIKNASQGVTADLFNYLRDQLKLKIPDGFTIIDGAREIAITNVSSPKAGTAGDQFAVTATGKVNAMAFRNQDEEELVAALFSTSSPKVFVEPGSALARTGVNLDIARHQLTYTLSNAVVLGGRLDRDAILQKIEGSSPGAIESALQTVPGLKAYKLKFFPFWLKNAPDDPAKINLTIEPFAAGS
ncbi:MAG: hypothetical protein HY220_04370 [Candidatus Sungbacteria bacterium]|uniref:Baseplate protein J-like domain-containing protein n=1 Tax=Candidatus Sungiibacteriota bacterium TaxID=2750080 RepID=A0A9D6LP70_9BACT|nr:hypothetical protein [Candidatus Sungbacteria bacterium]